MKSVKWFSKVILAILFIVILSAGQALADGTLKITDVQPNTDTIQAGDTVIFTIGYINEGDAEIPAETDIEIIVRLKSSNGVETSCTEPFTTDAAILAGGIRTFSDCYIVLEKEGEYNLSARINNGAWYEKEDPIVVGEPSALPEGLGQLFAGLGMFAAMMTILAVGTEVIIDSVRVLLGMKKKVTALESFQKLEKELPGKLADLGASVQDLKYFHSQLGVIQNTIKPVSDLAKIKEGDFWNAIVAVFKKEIIKIAKPELHKLINNLVNLPAGVTKTDIQAAVDKLLSEVSGNTIQDILVDLKAKLAASTLHQKTVEELTEKIEEQTDSIVNLILGNIQQNVLNIKGEIKQQVLKAFRETLNLLGFAETTISDLSEKFEPVLSNAITNIADKAIENLEFDKVVEAISDLLTKEGLGINTKWLEEQADTFFLKGKAYVLDMHASYVQPLLSQFGLNDVTIIETRSRLESVLDNISSEAEASTDMYVESLKNLLSTVEERRNSMQSPFRKAWRSIRNGSFPLWPVIVGAGLLALWIFLWPQSVFWKFALGLSTIIVMFAWGTSISNNLDHELLDEVEKISPTEKFYLKKAATNQAYPINIRRRAHALLILAEKGPKASLQDVGVTASCLYSWADNFNKKYAEPENLEYALKGHSRDWLKFFSIGDFFSLPETFFNFILRRNNEMGMVAQNVRDKIDNLNKTTVAAILQERDDKHRDEEASRLRLLRVISALIGVVLAYFVNVDAAELLDKAVPGVAQQINLNIVIFNPHSVWPDLPDRVITPGIILSGLAASAGSAFWHDQLDRLQAAKKGAESAAKLLQQTKEDSS